MSSCFAKEVFTIFYVITQPFFLDRNIVTPDAFVFFFMPKAEMLSLHCVCITNTIKLQRKIMKALIVCV